MRRPAVVLAAALTAACLAGSASAALKLVKRAGAFSSPVYATSAPGKRGIFVVEQAGRKTCLWQRRVLSRLPVQLPELCIELQQFLARAHHVARGT